MSKNEIRKAKKVFKIKEVVFSPEKLYSVFVGVPFLKDDEDLIEKNFEYKFLMLNDEIPKIVFDKFKEIKLINEDLMEDSESFKKECNLLLTEFVNEDYFLDVELFEQFGEKETFGKMVKTKKLIFSDYGAKLIKKDKIKGTEFSIDNEMLVNIKIVEYFNIQKMLNEKIKNNRGIDYKNKEIREKVLLALNAELMELCNETRCFNYWSKKERNADDVILEEFADVVCFGLTLWLEFGLKEEEIVRFFKPDLEDNNGLTKQFLKLLELSSKIKDLKTITEFMKELFKLGYMLGYDAEMILDAYKKKCLKNHEVQDNW